MPHVIVKLLPGRTEEQKKRLAEAITKDVMTIADCEEKVVSVAFEEIERGEWAEKVYRPDILNNPTSSIKSRVIILFRKGDGRDS